MLDGLTRWPDGFTVNPKLERQLLARRTMVERDEIDWALAEALSFGSLVLERHAGAPGGTGHPPGHVQPAPRRARRPAHRGRSTCPLAHLADDQAPFMLYDTVLSEYAALGFEYGYSIASDALVCWEAQFGDFANAAQVVIDQFVVAAADKWGQRSSMALLLPARVRGPGPRALERAHRALPHAVGRAATCASCTRRTAAQYFHVLRRQAVAAERVPLVCFTPKRYLRMPQTRSPLAAFTDGRFELVLDDRARARHRATA